MEGRDNINEDVRFEHRDVNVRALAWIGAAIVVTAVVLHFGLYFLFAGFRQGSAESGRVTKSQESLQRPGGGQPLLQVDPEAEMNAFRHEEQQKLSTYGWIDKEQGIVRIPIDRAMQIVAERGVSRVLPPETVPANAAANAQAPAVKTK